MLFNIVYPVGEPLIISLRRDFILLTKLSLEACGHEVSVSHGQVHPRAMNLFMRGYAREVSEFLLRNAGRFRFGILNTEVIAEGKLNHWLNETDYRTGYQYEAVMRRAEFVWELIHDNLERHRHIGTKAFFYRWGYHPALDEVRHWRQKELDYFFFGSDSPRRREIILSFDQAGVIGEWDLASPYFIRNSGIARARIQLNIKSNDAFSHANAFRIGYLAANRCAIISEPEHDTVGYTDYVLLCEREALIETVREYSQGEKHQALADRSYELFRQTDANQIMHELLAKTNIN